MSSAVEVAYSGEGPSDAVIAFRLIEAAGGVPGIDYGSRRRAQGKEALDRSIGGLNAEARRRPVLILRDLDHDQPCPGELVRQLVPEVNARLCLRIAVRAVESWLMADRERFAAAAGLSLTRIPDAAETLDNPKRYLIDQLRRSSRRDVRRIVDQGSSGRYEPQLLAGFIIGFAQDDWDPKRAAKSGRAPSLARALTRLSELVATAR